MHDINDDDFEEVAEAGDLDVDALVGRLEDKARELKTLLKRINEDRAKILADARKAFADAAEGLVATALDKAVSDLSSKTRECCDAACKKVDTLNAAHGRMEKMVRAIHNAPKPEAPPQMAPDPRIDQLMAAVEGLAAQVKELAARPAETPKPRVVAIHVRERDDYGKMKMLVPEYE